VQATSISWATATWNPTFGCSRVSRGCERCYAERLALQRGWSKHPWTAVHAKDNVRLRPTRLKEPYRLQAPARIFVNSMSDLFHAQVPAAFIMQVFNVMADTPQHTYMVLTKRPERAATWEGPWTPNIWMGVSVEDQKTVARLDILRPCKAAVLWMSAEPLLEDLGELNLDGYGWVVVGGESGPGYRPMRPEWARSIRDQCVARNVAYFYKQDAGVRSGSRPFLEEADGSLWEIRQWPDDVRSPVQVWPVEEDVGR
jgi:protein gp37